MRTADHRVHLLRRAGERFREVTSDKDWPTYNGHPGGNRYTALTQINKQITAQQPVQTAPAAPAPRGPVIREVPNQ